MTQMTQGTLHFQPEFVQAGRGPHLLEWAYATDPEWDSFHSDITCTANEGVRISDTEGREKFGINVRWNCEGFGYLFLTADNGGEFYTLPAAGRSEKLNLNLELARSRVARNARRLALKMQSGWIPSREVVRFHDLARELVSEAERAIAHGDTRSCAERAQEALYHALRTSEQIELEHAGHEILRRGARRDFFLGCDARGFYQMDPDLFLERFRELFDYATITHYLQSGAYQDFEPEEGRLEFDLRDAVLKKLKKQGITVEGRPLFWSYKTVTPEWLKRKSYDQVRRYVERHVRETVGHYGDELYAWEVVNEFHDWANECRLKPDEIIEVTRLACDTVKSVNPRVKRLINNCAPFAEYVQLKKMTELDAFYTQRTPYQFLKALTEAGVEFEIAGVQMYFPYRDLSDTMLMIEKFESLGKRMQLTEVGASSGVSEESLFSGKLKFPTEPFAWHRPWDEELQADWAESVYTLAYSRPQIEAANWYDFVDPHSWIPTGGLLRSPKGEKRAAFERLAALKARWKELPAAPG